MAVAMEAIFTQAIFGFIVKITQGELEPATRLEVRAAPREFFDGMEPAVDDEFFVHGIPSFLLKCKNAAWQKPYGVWSGV